MTDITPVDFTLKGGKYKGRSFHWILDNDLHYFMRWFRSNEESKESTNFLRKVLKHYGVSNLKMTFGKYKGATIMELFKIDPSYLTYLGEDGHAKFLGTLIQLKEEEMVSLEPLE